MNSEIDNFSTGETTDYSRGEEVTNRVVFMSIIIFWIELEFVVNEVERDIQS